MQFSFLHIYLISNKSYKKAHELFIVNLSFYRQTTTDSWQIADEIFNKFLIFDDATFGLHIAGLRIKEFF